MAHYVEPTAEQEAGWAEWVASRPDNVRAVAERFNPWTLYRFKDSAQRCTLVSFGAHDDGSVTLTVNVTGQFNLVAFDRSVFGVDPGNLEECDLPTDGEINATMLTDEGDIEAFVDFVRPAVLAARADNDDLPSNAEGAKE